MDALTTSIKIVINVTINSYSSINSKNIITENVTINRIVIILLIVQTSSLKMLLLIE